MTVCFLPILTRLGHWAQKVPGTYNLGVYASRSLPRGRCTTFDGETGGGHVGFTVLAIGVSSTVTSGM